VASIGEAVRIAPTTLPVLSLAHAPATAGERDSATRTLASIEDRGTRTYVPSYEIAKVHLALGQLGALRTDPRFQNLVSRVNDRK
jgi:hypothetical protein